MALLDRFAIDAEFIAGFPNNGFKGIHPEALIDLLNLADNGVLGTPPQAKARIMSVLQLDETDEPQLDLILSEVQQAPTPLKANKLRNIKAALHSRKRNFISEEETLSNIQA